MMIGGKLIDLRSGSVIMLIIDLRCVKVGTGYQGILVLS